LNLVTRTMVSLIGTGSKSVGLSGGPNGSRLVTDPLNVNHYIELASGTGAGKADQSYHVQGTIGASATTINTASGGGLTNAFGESVAMLYHRGLWIQNTGSVTITVGGTAGIVGSGFPIRPGGFVLLGTGTAEATGHAIGTITLAGNGATYDIAVIGATA
jgi:hypothetical protein